MYATNKPAAISQGVPLDHCPNGVQNSRAISILIAITGNLDIVGGNIYNPPLKQASLKTKGMVSLDEAIGAQFPIFSKFTGQTTAMPVTEALITGKPYSVKAARNKSLLSSSRGVIGRRSSSEAIPSIAIAALMGIGFVARDFREIKK